MKYQSSQKLFNNNTLPIFQILKMSHEQNKINIKISHTLRRKAT